MREKKPYLTHCERCGNSFKRNSVSIHTMSWFNLEHICIDCRNKEQQHPDFQRAKDAEIAALRAGDYNFSGIGKPADL